MNDTHDQTESIDIELKHPFDFGENRHISKFTIQRPKAIHMRGVNFQKIEDKEGDEILKLIHKLSGEPPRVVDRLDLSDVMAIMEVVQAFLPSGPESGPTL